MSATPTITNGGTAYDATTVQVAISAPDLVGGAQATASAVVDTTAGSLTLGQVIGFTNVTPGSGYTKAPTITVYDASNNVPLGTLVGGVQNTVAPSAVVTAALQSTGSLFGLTLTNPGTGYTSAPAISFSTGAGAVAATSLVNPVGSLPGNTGTLAALQITNVGSGYTVAPTVTITDVNNNTSAKATVSLATPAGTITGITVTNPGVGYTSAPAISFTNSPAAVTPVSAVASATAKILGAGVGAQAAIVTSTSSTIPVLTKAEQELYDDWGRYNSTGGVELPLTLVGIQTTVPLGYIDSPTDVIGDDEIQIWKLVDNGFWSNSIHFNMNDVQLINRVGWDGTVKPPASNEVGWKDTVRLNPLEDAIVAIRGKATNIPFSLPRSTRLQDPSTPAATPNFPVAPAMPVAGTRYAPGLGFTADPAVVQSPGTAASNPAALLGVPFSTPVAVLPTPTVLLATAVNTASFPASPTGNFDNEFVWGSAILGHAENDFTRPVVFNPVVTKPDAPVNLADPTGTGNLVWTDPTPKGQLASAPGVAPVLAATLGNPKNELGFKILQAPVTINAVTGAQTVGAFAPYASVPANVTKWAEPAALITGKPPYFAYMVDAYNVAGDTTSNVAIEAPPLAPTLPASVGGVAVAMLTPSYIAGTNSVTNDVGITVAWQDNATNEANYIITRTGPGVLANGHVTGGTTVTYTAPANTAPPSTNTSYVDPAPVGELQSYEYDVIARNVFGDSIPVLVGTITTPSYMPAAPTNLAAAPIVVAPCPVDAVTKVAVPTQCRPDTVSLTFTDNAVNETGYNVLRNGVQIGTVAATALNVSGGTLTYGDTTAAEGVAYSYTVQAVNAAGVATSTPLSYTLPPTAPTLPTNFSVVPATAVDATGVYLDQAVLTWSDNAYNETSYQVLRDGTVVTTLAANNANNPMGTGTASWASSPIMTYTDMNNAAGTALGDGSSHTWAVQAINATGTTPSANVTLAMPGIVIAAPQNLVARPNRAGASIALSWSDMSNNETDFLVEEQVSTDGGLTFKSVANTGVLGGWTALPVIPRAGGQTTANGAAVVVNYARNNVPTTAGYVYNFRVSARNLAAKSDSAYAFVQAALTAPNVPATPVPTVTAAGGRVTVAWPAQTAQAGTRLSYVVTVNGVQVPVFGSPYRFRPNAAQLATGSVTISVQAVATAIRGAGQTLFGSSASAGTTPVKIVTAIPAVPTAVTATQGAAGSRAITVKWTAPAGLAPTGYTIQRQTVNATTGVPITGFINVGNVAAGVLTFTNGGLTVGTTYRYQVRANGTFGNSVFVANTANATAR
jgi:hypothetical protein